MVTATVQRYTRVENGTGGYTYEWDDYIQLNGFLDKLSGDEVVASEKLGAISSHVFITFTIADVNESDRMIIGGKIYNIKDVDNPMSMDRHMEILLENTGERYVG